MAIIGAFFMKITDTCMPRHLIFICICNVIYTSTLILGCVVHVS